MFRTIAAVAVALAVMPVAAIAQPAATEEQSREADLFAEDDGTAKPAAPAPATPGVAATPAPATEVTGDLGDSRASGQVTENTELLRDHTQLGGLFYLRNGLQWNEDTDASDQRLTQSTLVDLYLDARVNDRVRAYLRGRTVYNPLADTAATSPMAGLLGAKASADEVSVLLDQAWLKFDIARRVFLTLGKQQVRWGTTRMWNPVDVINPTRRDPLTFFDERQGLPMVKIHVPFENGWNGYLLALTDDAAKLDQPGVASRIEYVVESAEIGLVGAVRKGQDPKVGLDLSAGVGDFDVTGELGTVFVGDTVEWQASAGVSWTWAYAEDDSFSLGVEYFHNAQGAGDDAGVVSAGAAAIQAGKPWPYQPFYTGTDYAAVVAAVVSPGPWTDAVVSFIGLTNLSDGSALGRLSLQGRVLTDLSLEGYVSAPVGEGEFTGYTREIRKQFGPMATLIGAELPTRQVATVGLNLRVDM